MTDVTVALAWVWLNEHPGITASDLCAAVGLMASRTDSLLMKMDSLGYVVSEDEDRIYPLFCRSTRFGLVEYLDELIYRDWEALCLN
jgi:DNA-binding IclR family transcriptional regulator